MPLAPHSILDRLEPAPLARSMFSSGLRWSVAAILMAVALPVVLDGLGSVRFGYWALLTTPTSLAALLDLGVIPSVVSLAGRRLARARTGVPESRALIRESGSLVLAGIVQSLAMGLIAAVIGLAIADSCVDAAGLPVSIETSGLFLFRCSIFNLAMTIVGNGLIASTEAVGRVDLTSWGAGFLSILNSALMIVAVWLNPTLGALGWVVAINGVATVVCYLTCAFIARVPVLIRVGSVDRGNVYLVSRLGLGMGAAGAVGSVVDPLVKWTTLLVAGPLAVSAFEVAQRVVGMSVGATRSLLYPLMTHFTTVIGRDGDLGLRSAVELSTVRTASLVLPAFGALAAGIAAVYDLWLGPAAPPGVSVATAILFVTSAVSVIATPSYHALQSIAHSKSLIAVQTSGAVVAVVATLALGTLHGGASTAAAGFGLGVAAGGFLTFILFARAIPRGVGAQGLVGKIAPSIAALFGMMLLGVGLIQIHATPWLQLMLTVICMITVVLLVPESRKSLSLVTGSVARRWSPR